MKRDVYLVRHGHCEGSGTLLGQADTLLTAEGLAQARKLAEQFAELRVERIVASDLQRAARTAEIIAQRLRIGFATDRRLREISYGEWDGRYWSEIEAPYASGWTPVGAEGFPKFVERVNQAWESIQRSGAAVTLVVAHRGVNSLLFAAASGRRWPDLPEFQQDYGTALKISLSHEHSDSVCK